MTYIAMYNIVYTGNYSIHIGLINNNGSLLDIYQYTLTEQSPD